MNDRNYNNIQRIFQESTGVKLKRQRPMAARVAALTVLAAMLCLLAAFAWPLFSPLDGDALTLQGEYLGNGMVQITAINQSDKDLNFQSQVRLFEWVTDVEVTPAEGTPVFSETRIPAGTEVTFTVDLSGCYDVAALEESHYNIYHYLVLTNQNFFHGQQWKCTVRFTQEWTLEQPAREDIVSMEPEILANVEPELQYYFETEHYAGAFSFNPHHYEYLQKVEELLQRCGKRIVESVNVGLMVEPVRDGVILDESWPAELQYQLGYAQQITLSDAFGRLVCGGEHEHIKYLACQLPCYYKGEEGIYLVPLLYFSTFPALEIQSPEDCAFIHGQIVSFAELEPYLVYDDGAYVCYNVTHLFYTDLETYLRSYAAAEPHGDQREYPMGEDQLHRAEAVLEYYQENLKILSPEEWMEAVPACRITDFSGTETCSTGLAGTMTADCDILEVYIFVTDAAGNTVYSETLVPEDPRCWDMATAEEASGFLMGLSGGTYTLEIAVRLDAPYIRYRTQVSCILEP